MADLGLMLPRTPRRPQPTWRRAAVLHKLLLHAWAAQPGPSPLDSGGSCCQGKAEPRRERWRRPSSLVARWSDVAGGALSTWPGPARTSEDQPEGNNSLAFKYSLLGTPAGVKIRSWGNVPCLQERALGRLTEAKSCSWGTSRCTRGAGRTVSHFTGATWRRYHG